jgi:hypothetical protein
MASVGARSPLGKIYCRFPHPCLAFAGVLSFKELLPTFRLPSIHPLHSLYYPLYGIHIHPLFQLVPHAFFIRQVGKAHFRGIDFVDRDAVVLLDALQDAGPVGVDAGFDGHG